MKKQNQIKRKNSSASREPQPRVRRIPLFSTDQLERIPIDADPSKLPIKRSVLSQRETRRLRFITLSADQAQKLGPGLPTLEAFLPLATDLQLVPLLDAVPLQWSRKELGPRPGEVTLMAIVNPARHELAPPIAAQLRALVAKEVASRKRLSKRIKQLSFLRTHASTEQWREFSQKIAKLARAVAA